MFIFDMGNFGRVFIAVVLIISLFTVSVFATPTGTYDLYGTNGRVVTGYTGSGNDYISNFSGHLANIRVYLDQILSYNSNISSTIDYYLPALLQRMVDAFSPVSGDTRSMWQLSAAAVSGITAIQSTALGIAQDVYSINTTTADIDRLIGLIHSDVDQVESQLSSVNSNLQSLESINWSYLNNYSVKYSFDNITYYDNYNDLGGYNTDLYIKIQGTFTNTSLYNFIFPLYVNWNREQYPIHLEILSNGQDLFDNFVLYQNVESISILINPFTLFYNNNNYSTVFHFYSDKQISYLPERSISVRYINADYLDYYNIASYIELTKLNDKNLDLSDIKNILIDIDNNSDFIQNNNDLQINVDIDSSVGQGVTGVISKIQDLLDFGISLQEFLVVLNQFDNLHWFTRLETYEQVNYDPRTNLGYQNLYD